MNNALSKCVLTVSILLCIPLSVKAFSFSSLSSWFSSWQDEAYFKEADCGLNGTLELTNISGPINVKTWSVPKIVIEATKSAKEHDLPAIFIETDINEHRALIKTVYHNESMSGSVSYDLMIPEHTNVTIHTDEGAIKLKKVRGNISVYSGSGSIDIEEATRSLQAHTNSGSINSSSVHVPLNAHLQLTTDNGNITLALPKKTNARVSAKTNKGIITSEQSITVAPQTVKLDKNYWRRVRTEISGLIGNGGAVIDLIADYGNIKIVEQ